LSRRFRNLVLTAAVLATLTLAVMPESEPDVRVATFNIELFLSDRTDLARVVETIAAADADVIGVQEIANPLLLQMALVAVSDATGRELALVRSQCGDTGWFSPAIVYDAARWTLVVEREYPALDPDRRSGCSRADQSAVLAVLADEDDRRIAVISVHLRAHPDKFHVRREQWSRALRIARDVEDEFSLPTVLLGDMNSTGFTGEPAEERDFVRDVVADAGFELLTDELGCSEYWHPKDVTFYEPSVLDHIVVSGGGSWGDAEVQGYCARLACRRTPVDRMDPDFHHVSDHCPVVVEGALD
jgi:endonuclease/exonuclease/phosphatase family metal-dependent hydrolase